MIRLSALAAPQVVIAIAAAFAVATCGGSTPAATVAPAAATPAVTQAADGGYGAPAPATEAPPAAAGSTVGIKSFSFTPASITIAVGDSITWTNNDSAGHTVTADDGSFDSGRLSNGASFTQAFATAGTFTYHCAIHSSMKATVVVQ